MVARKRANVVRCDAYGRSDARSTKYHCVLCDQTIPTSRKTTRLTINRVRTFPEESRCDDSAEDPAYCGMVVRAKRCSLVAIMLTVNSGNESSKFTHIICCTYSPIPHVLRIRIGRPNIFEASTSRDAFIKTRSEQARRERN